MLLIKWLLQIIMGLFLFGCILLAIAIIVCGVLYGTYKLCLFYAHVKGVENWATKLEADNWQL